MTERFSTPVSVSPPPDPQPNLARSAAIFGALFVIALFCDRALAVWVRESGVAGVVKGSWWAEVLKAPGTFHYVALELAAACLLLRIIDWRGAVFVCISAGLGIVNHLLKLSVGRFRPFTYESRKISEAISWNALPFHGFTATNLSFASGHATMSFSMATAFAILLPRWRAIFYVVATITSLERVSESAHWPSDAVAGAALGYFGVHLLWRLISPRLWNREAAIYLGKEGP